MKCKISHCKASCCYNIPFQAEELERFADKIVTPVIGFYFLNGAKVAVTNQDWQQNKCPFLTEECKCNIYESRPEICRCFGEIAALPCALMKK